MTPRKLKAEEVAFEVIIEQEDVPVRGHFASGDTEEDRKAEQWVIDQVSSGNVYAWCWVKVTARWEGLEGSDSLGCCSYESRAALNKDVIDGGYGLKENALANLNAQLVAMAKKLKARL